MEFFMKFLKSQSGFSLAEIMVAAALMGVIALGTMRMMKTQTKNVSTNEAKMEMASTINSIRVILSEREACYNTFGITAGTPDNTGTHDANNTPAGDITEIINKDGNTQFTSNTNIPDAPRIGGTNVRILSFRLSTAHSDVETIPDSSSGQTELIVRFYRGKSTFGQPEVEKKILLNTRTDASGIMIDCGSQAVNSTLSDASFTCSTLGGTFDEAGRSGNGDCHSLNPNSTTTFNGNLVVNDTFSIELLSDLRLKTDITPIENPLNIVSKLETVRFNWTKNDRPDIGFLAQNIKSVLPELVSKTKRGFYSVKYSQVTALNTSALKELNNKVDKLIMRVEELEDENYQLKEELKRMRD